jgi:DNA-binding LacI/PurR family transcriptional regulator
MAGRQDGSRPEDAERREVERIMRAAEALGHDPRRVARALHHGPVEPGALQQTMDLERRPVLTRFFARGFARRS